MNDDPISFRAGKTGIKLKKVASRTGLKQPDILKLALVELFKAYPDDRSLAQAVFNYRLTEAVK